MTNNSVDRRKFIKTSGNAAAGHDGDCWSFYTGCAGPKHPEPIGFTREAILRIFRYRHQSRSHLRSGEARAELAANWCPFTLRNPNWPRVQQALSRRKTGRQ